MIMTTVANAVTNTIANAIAQAIQGGDIKFIEEFVSVNDIETKLLIAKETMLICASFHGQVSIVTLLLKKGCNVNATDKNKNTALMTAAHKNHFDIVVLLINHNANVNMYNCMLCTALHRAAYNNNTRMTIFLINNGANVNQSNNEGWNALMSACLHNNQEIAKILKSKKKSMLMQHMIIVQKLHYLSHACMDIEESLSF